MSIDEGWRVCCSFFWIRFKDRLFATPPPVLFIAFTPSHFLFHSHLDHFFVLWGRFIDRGFILGQVFLWSITLV